VIGTFRKLLTLDEAEEVIRRHFKLRLLGVENASLLEACNRVLAENVISTLDIPPFNRSTVDGYAVKAEDTFGAEENKPAKVRVSGTVNVGEPTRIEIGDGEATEIVTGAPMPRGADAVVMMEDTKRKGNQAYVFSAVAINENVMKAGADIKKGETVLEAGQLLGSREIGVAAAVGLARVKVHAVPRVAVLSTGAEVNRPGNKLPSGKIYDINAYSLSAAVLESGGQPVFLGVFPDDRKALREALKKALCSADMVITSGGVSVGPKDVIPQTVDSLGKPGVIVSGIAIKPGKPVTVAVVDGKLVFSLPGHPASALLIFQLLARPFVRVMGGRKAEKSLKVKAAAGMRMFPAKGRRTFIMVRLRRDKLKRLIAEPVETGLSGAITTLARAKGFVEIPENQQFIDAGENVVVTLFKNLGENKY
jgi:molybdenum cofactor synthesis domain-containing protein